MVKVLRIDGDVPDALRSLATEISESPITGDPDRKTVSALEVARAWNQARRMDPSDRERLVMLSGLLDVRVPRHWDQHDPAASVFGPARLDPHTRKPINTTRLLNTIGPATDSVDILVKMIESGTNAVRINFSHVRTFEEARSRIDMLEEAMRITGETVKILADLQGPRIRTVRLPASMPLGAGQTIRLVDARSGGPPAPEVLPFDARGALEDLRAGHRILLDDGKLLLTVIRADNGEVVARVDRGGEIRKERRTGMNLPDTILRHRVPTEDDLLSIDIIQRLRLGDRSAVDMVAVSFVESGDDVRRVGRALDMPGVALMAKIERPAAVAELLARYEGRDIGTRVIDDILAASAAIMIARGDLAVEVGAERVPLLADDLHAMGRHTGVPVGRATQMLESMTTESTPLRAESNDIVDAVQDGAAFVMTSGETAVGNHPVEVVKVMLQHVVTAERAIRTSTPPWD